MEIPQEIILFEYPDLLELLVTVIISGFILGMIVMIVGLAIYGLINIFKKI